jgi:uncharacterized damage-inducible protein DinB
MNILTNQTLECLEDLSTFLRHLSDTDFQKQLPPLNGATVGKHVRHILEFYDQLFQDERASVVNYDTRSRNPALENHPQFALDFIDQLSRFMAQGLSDRMLQIDADLFSQGEPANSSMKRELLYAYEHMVHHMALIRVACHGSLDYVFSFGFGVAYATKQFQAERKCAQ